MIFGTSRSDIGLSPTHPALDADVINLAMSSQPNRESRMLFEKMASAATVGTAVVGLDFFVANSALIQPPDFLSQNFDSSQRLNLLASISVSKDAIKTILKRKTYPGDAWTPRGLRTGWAERVETEFGHRKVMQGSEKSYLSNHYLAPPICSFIFESISEGTGPLDEIRAIFSRAHRDRIRLKLLISPSHARQWETLAGMGLWGKWEEWKRRLVMMNEEEAHHAGQPTFPLWDFSGYNSISTEAVPPLGDTQTVMRWYFDSSHYTPAAGDLVLDRIFNFKSPERSVPDDFGVLLTSQTIEPHLARIRADRETYRQTHPQDVAEIEAMASKVAKTKRCKPAPL